MGRTPGGLAGSLVLRFVTGAERRWESKRPAQREAEGLGSGEGSLALSSRPLCGP